MAVWSMERCCVVPLCLLMIGQWGVIIWCWSTFSLNISSQLTSDLLLAIHGTGGSWVASEGCIRRLISLPAQLVTLIYSLTFDFIVLLLCAYKLVGPFRSKSRLVNLLFRDGLIYFVIVWVLHSTPVEMGRSWLKCCYSFLGTLPSAILLSLNLNPVMDVMVITPSLYISLVGFVLDQVESLSVILNVLIVDHSMSCRPPIVELFCNGFCDTVRLDIAGLLRLMVTCDRFVCSPSTTLATDQSKIIFRPANVSSSSSSEPNIKSLHRSPA